MAGMENDLLRWFRQTLPGHKQLVLGAGDDAAVIRWTDGRQLVATTDMLMDGIDFRVGEHDPAAIGHKALAVNLSDLAAMAARPVAALVSLCLPRSDGELLAKQLYAGILATAAKHNVAIAGGDTNSWDGPLVISVVALGEVQPGREWRRSGARPRDRILVTGMFGGSILGKHLRPTPRVEEALWLADHAEIHAAIDVSDGLSLDLSRLTEASQRGAVIDLDTVPIDEAAERLARESRDDATAIDHALADGEDFELILAVAPGEADRLAKAFPFELPLTDIGCFTEQPGLWTRNKHGELQPLAPRGWEHRLDS
jgi:thiamine-monophosphate kinase